VTAHARLEDRLREVDPEDVVLGRLEITDVLDEDRERALDRRVDDDLPLGAAFLLRSDGAERWAGIAVVLTILASAIGAGVFAVHRIVSPLAPEHLLALGLAGGAGVLGNAVAARVRLDGGRRLESRALIADGNHARSDALVSGGVVLSAIAVALGATIADPIIGLAITAMILQMPYGSWRTVIGHAHSHA
jgi:Cation efflux family